MNATQPPDLPSHPVKPAKSARAGAPRKQRSHKPQTLETSAMLAANLLLLLMATTALVKLIPYQQSQQAKLQEIQLAVKQAQARVKGIKAQFNRNFDPKQAGQIMQEQTPWMNPQQHQVILVGERQPSKSP